MEWSASKNSLWTENHQASQQSRVSPFPSVNLIQKQAKCTNFPLSFMNPWEFLATQYINLHPRKLTTSKHLKDHLKTLGTQPQVCLSTYPLEWPSKVKGQIKAQYQESISLLYTPSRKKV